jgi:glycosyltransferase involved in cell wall biosynthesis
MPIRIARILGRPNVGGPARTALHLTRRLAAHGFETLLIVGAPGEREGDLLDGVTDVAIERIPEMRRAVSLSDVAAGRRLRAVLEGFAPTIVHTHAAKAGALGRRAALRLASRPKLVHTFHGHSLAGYFPRPLAAFFARIERELAAETDALIAVSEEVRRELALVHRIAPESRFTVIRNGIDLEPFTPPSEARRRDARARLRVSGAETKVVIVPARLAAVKGHELLFAALARWPASAPPLEVHLVGDGPLRSRLERRAARVERRSPGMRIVFHGHRDDLPRMLDAADVVVLPSRSEGMSLALIEAMAAARPIVATAVGGTPDLIATGTHGLLVPRDPLELVLALRRVLLDPAFASRLGAAARRAAIEHHDIERVVLQHAELYQGLLAGLPAPAAPRAQRAPP